MVRLELALVRLEFGPAIHAQTNKTNRHRGHFRAQKGAHQNDSPLLFQPLSGAASTNLRLTRRPPEAHRRE